MNKVFLSLVLVAAVSAHADAQKKVLLNEDFSSVAVNYDDHYAPLDIEGWQITTSETAPVFPVKWCVYASGTSSKVNNVACIDRKYDYDVDQFSGVLYTPLLDLDGTYQLS